MCQGQDARGGAPRLRAAGALLIGKTNLDQFATGLVGRAHALSRAAQRRGAGPRAGRVVLGLGGGGGAGHRDALARHRHGRVGPRAGGAERHRRAEALARRGLHARRGAGLPHARLRVGLRDLPSRMPGPASACWPARTAPIPSRAPIAWRGAAAPVPARIARARAGRPAPRRRRRRAPPGPPRARLLPGRARTPTITPLLDTARLLYDGPWVAERAAAFGDFAAAHPGALHPVTQAHHRPARRASAPWTPSAASTAWPSTAAPRSRFFARVDVLAVPSVPCFPTLAELEADPLRPECAARHLHQLREPAGPGRARGAGAGAAGRAARRHHADRTARVGCRARRARHAASPRASRNSGKARAA